MTVGQALKTEQQELMSLWKVCFGDEDEYIKSFFERRFDPNNTLVLRADGAVRSMLFLLPGAVKADGEEMNAAYLYAACTDPAYRSRGCMAQLLEAAREHCINQGLHFICLTPAQESLFGYYSKHGYISAFEEKTLFFSRRQLKAISAESVEKGALTAADMKAVRSASLSRTDCFVWDETALRYAIYENKAGECDDVACFEDGRCTAYALFYEEGEKLVIKECAARSGALPALMRALLEATQCDVFFFHLPVRFPISADVFEVRQKAMLLPLNAQARLTAKNMQNAYMGLCLD